MIVEPPYPEAFIKSAPSAAEPTQRRFQIWIENVVIELLMQLFHLSIEEATAMMARAHQDGRSLIATLPEDEVEQCVTMAQQISYEAGYVLRFTVTPEQRGTRIW